MGLEGEFCPYYAMRKRIHEADIILMPYNYMLNTDIRSRIGIDFANSLILIDEAHNV